MKRIAGLIAALWFLLLFPLPAAADCSAKSALVLEAASGTVLYEKAPDLPLPEASTTKIMTALLVLENADPDALVTVSSAAAAAEGSRFGFAPGNVLSVRDLLYVLMLKSGNDAAVALAEHVDGTVERFVQRMNRKAEEWDLRATRFRNPHGLPAEGHVTTARDLARLTARAMENDAFRELVNTKKAQLTFRRQVIENSNKLLTACEGVCGVKTGFTKAAGRCLVSAARRDGVLLICVTLNDPNDWADHAALYDRCFARVRRETVIPAGTYRVTLPVPGGEREAVLVNSRDLTGITVDGTPLSASPTAALPPFLFAPVLRGKICGEVRLTTPDGAILSRSPLTAAEAVGINEEPSFTARCRHALNALRQALFGGT